jgi:hypothetical protein
MHRAYTYPPDKYDFPALFVREYLVDQKKGTFIFFLSIGEEKDECPFSRSCTLNAQNRVFNVWVVELIYRLPFSPRRQARLTLRVLLRIVL